MNSLGLQSFRLKNFKAVRDSGIIHFTPLTAFVGNNGSGKSSIIEGLETLHSIAENGLDRAMQSWLGFDLIWNQAIPHTPAKQRGEKVRPYLTNPMSFEMEGVLETSHRSESRFARNSKFTATMEITEEPEGNTLFIKHEKLLQRGAFSFTFTRDDFSHVSGRYRADGLEETLQRTIAEDETLINMPLPAPYEITLKNFISEWQFVSLVPQEMGLPKPQKRTGGKIRLAKDGSNVAEYLLNIRRIDQRAFDGIVSTLQYILPYTSDLQPTLTSELERAVYLQMTEGVFKVPGWLLSTGTLRILALLALLRHPEPPPLIVIEELENGLDPRSVSLIVDEIRNVIEEGKSQIIISTHSPYLLDLLLLSHIVMVERIDGQPIFTRPSDQESLQIWAEKFSPGSLYTMNKLSKAG